MDFLTERFINKGQITHLKGPSNIKLNNLTPCLFTQRFASSHCILFPKLIKRSASFPKFIKHSASWLLIYPGQAYVSSPLWLKAYIECSYLQAGPFFLTLVHNTLLVLDLCVKIYLDMFLPSLEFPLQTIFYALRKCIIFWFSCFLSLKASMKGWPSVGNR